VKGFINSENAKGLSVFSQREKGRHGMPLFTLRQTWLWVGAIIGLIGLGSRILAADVQGWEPFRNESTLEVLTVDKDAREHWSKFWLVVLDGQLYLRLGTRGAARIDGNTKKPFASVKIAGQRFDNVRIIETPEMTKPVAAAVADKYWSDLLIRWFPHPMTVRLERGQ
jgi:hypothetical protein